MEEADYATDEAIAQQLQNDTMADTAAPTQSIHYDEDHEISSDASKDD